MLEASIRKVSVTVKYQEGHFDRELAITQYVTNPQQGQLDPSLAGHNISASLRLITVTRGPAGERTGPPLSLPPRPCQGGLFGQKAVTGP